MATDAAKELSFYLCLPKSHLSPLGHVRNWQHLKMGAEDDLVWVKGFTEVEINSTLVRSMPFAKRYREDTARLYPVDSALPERNVPSVLWSPIDRYLPLEIESYNHNYFGLEDQVKVDLIPSSQEKTAYALVTSVDALASYIEMALDFRLEPIKWLVLGNDKALLMGQPLLPLPGQTYWKQGSLLLPAGYELSHNLLYNAVTEKLALGKGDLALWDIGQDLVTLKASYFKALSISSVRLTINKTAQRQGNVF